MKVIVTVPIDIDPQMLKSFEDPWSIMTLLGLREDMGRAGGHYGRVLESDITITDEHLNEALFLTRTEARDILSGKYTASEAAVRRAQQVDQAK